MRLIDNDQQVHIKNVLKQYCSVIRYTMIVLLLDVDIKTIHFLFATLTLPYHYGMKIMRYDKRAATIK